MKKILFTAGLLVFSAHLTAQTSVTEYKPGLTESGITYFLPQTRLHVTVTAQRTTYHPGEFCQYAERFLRINDVEKTERDEWELISVEVTPYGVADKTKAYTIQLKPKTSAPFVGLASDGRLLSINADIPKLKALSAPSVYKEKGTLLNPEEYKTEEIITAGSTLKMAELTANEIYDIRENRSLLSKGQADFMPKDGEQLKLMLKTLDTQEEALLQLFKGTSSRETHVFTLDLFPEQELQRHVLFRFSKHLGLVDRDNMAGEPVYITLKDLKSLPAEVVVEEKKGKKKEVLDVRYTLPGTAYVKIFTPERELLSLNLQLAQFGRVEHLGGELFNKKYTTHIIFSPETGGIVKLDAEQPE
ncbi:MAG: DUF4831 family protein [Bacteroidaceae bacterium]|nr:DUF4831 family protein [Bacteroidaceae bacterium]